MKPSAAAAPLSGGKKQQQRFHEDQEVPPIRQALERAEASLSGREMAGTGCCHLWPFLPHQLSLELCHNSDGHGLRLRNPVHALHLASQWDPSETLPHHLSTSHSKKHDTTAKDNDSTNQWWYAEEQERSWAAVSAGVVPVYHEGVVSNLPIIGVPTNARNSKDLAATNSTGATPSQSSSKANVGTSAASTAQPMAVDDDTDKASLKAKHATSADADANKASTTDGLKDGTSTPVPKIAEVPNETESKQTEAENKNTFAESEEIKSIKATQNDEAMPTQNSSTADTELPPSRARASTEAQETKQEHKADSLPVVAEKADDSLHSSVQKDSSNMEQVVSSTLLEDAPKKPSQYDTKEMSIPSALKAGDTEMAMVIDEKFKSNVPELSAHNVIGSQKENPVEASPQTLSKEAIVAGLEQVSGSTGKLKKSELPGTKKDNDVPVVNSMPEGASTEGPRKIAETSPQDPKAKDQNKVVAKEADLPSKPVVHDPPTGGAITLASSKDQSNSPPASDVQESTSAEHVNQNEEHITTQEATKPTPPKIGDASASTKNEIPPVSVPSASASKLSADTTSKADSSKEPERTNLLDDAEFNMYRSQEDKVNALRRSLFSKRAIPPSNRKSKSSQSSGQAKKRKVEQHRLSEWLYSPPIAPALSPVQEQEYKAAMIKAVDQVEIWMEHYRLARRTYWRWKRSSGQSQQKFSH
jgi:hypothetical protein